MNISWSVAPRIFALCVGQAACVSFSLTSPVHTERKTDQCLEKSENANSVNAQTKTHVVCFMQVYLCSRHQGTVDTKRNVSTRVWVFPALF